MGGRNGEGFGVELDVLDVFMKGWEYKLCLVADNEYLFFNLHYSHALYNDVLVNNRPHVRW